MYWHAWHASSVGLLASRHAGLTKQACLCCIQCFRHVVGTMSCCQRLPEGVPLSSPCAWLTLDIQKGGVYRGVVQDGFACFACV